MRTYYCVDLLHQGEPKYIEASSPDVARKRYFKEIGISEKPVRSAKQVHARDLDGRFYTRTNNDVGEYNARHTLICFNREGYEFYACCHNEFDESKGKSLPWAECANL